jgi:hypothetical protein
MRRNLLITQFIALLMFTALPAWATSSVEINDDQSQQVQDYFDSLSGGGSDNGDAQDPQVSDEQPITDDPATPIVQPVQPVVPKTPKIDTPKKPAPQAPAKPKPTVPAKPQPPKFAQCDGSTKPAYVKTYDEAAAMIKGVLGFDPGNHQLMEAGTPADSGLGQIHIFLINDHGASVLWEGTAKCKPGQLFQGTCSKSQPGLFCQLGPGKLQITANDGGKLVKTYITKNSASSFRVSGDQDHSHDNNFTLTGAAQ